MRPSRRTLLAAGLTAPLAACSTPQRRGAGGPVEITFWSALRGSQQVVDAFNSSQNRIKVIFQQIPSGGQGGYAKLSNAARAGNAPDVATIEYPQVPGYAIDGVARDITDLVTDRLKQKLLPQALKLTTFDNRVFSVPLDIEPMVLHYRADVFEANGFQLPRTWDDFTELARKVKAEFGNKKLVLFPTDGAMQFACFAWQAGAQWFDTGDGKWQVSLADA
ncbi:MAG TPA: extracellular solute-binding protein, partial [Lentzea sp.]